MYLFRKRHTTRNPPHQPKEHPLTPIRSNTSCQAEELQEQHKGSVGIPQQLTRRLQQRQHHHIDNTTIKNDTTSNNHCNNIDDEQQPLTQQPFKERRYGDRLCGGAAPTRSRRRLSQSWCSCWALPPFVPPRMARWKPGRTWVALLLWITSWLLLLLWDHWFFSVLPAERTGPGSTIMKLPSSSSTFAVAINTYRRPDMLREAVQHYADTCGLQTGVSQVFVIWAEQTNAYPHPSSFFSDGEVRTGKDNIDGQESSSQQGHVRATTIRKIIDSNRAKVIVLPKSKDSLNSRFEPIDQLTSDGVFMVDDDVHVACPSLQTAFEAWKAHPDSLVGYYPRLASQSRKTTDPKSSSSTVSYIYHTWPVVYMRQSFNIVLTKACFLHSQYLELYSGDRFPQAIRDYVDEHHNCEDIAMSMLVANYTATTTTSKVKNRAYPIYVEGSVQDKGLFGGISTGTGHMTTRSECVTDLSRLFQSRGWDPPFQDAVSLSSHSWIQHAPGFWWQANPSNLFEWLSLGNLLST